MLCSVCQKRPAVIFLSFGEQTAPAKGVCMRCAQNMDTKSLYDMMKENDISDKALDKMSDQIAGIISAMDLQNFDELEENQGGAVTFSPFMKNIFADFPFSRNSDSKNEKNSQERTKKSSKKRYVEMYCDNLNKKAKENRLDRVIGREIEIARVIQILSRRTKNNPCLTGEPGVGKTAIAEGLALKINAGDVPLKLREKEICLLDLTALVAGTQFRGQFESRIKGLMDEVKNDGNIILFIDEVHNLVGAGDSEGSMSAANILKPALSRNEIQVIGATTFAEYGKYIERDAALERRFQQVKILEPSVKQSTELLIGIKCYYENYHRVIVPDSLAHRIVILSERYITGRFLPDKSIDLLDESCAATALSNVFLEKFDNLNLKLEELKNMKEKILNEPEIDYEGLARIKSDVSQLSENLEKIRHKAIGKVVTEEDVAGVIELWTGIPVDKIQENEFKQLENLESKIRKKIKGQDLAISKLCSAVRRNRLQLSGAERVPCGVVCVGPSGVGKTELVKVLSDQIFGPRRLIRLDMSEYMEKHTVSKIIGSPPGYVGYDESGQITEKVRQRPYSVILFDEIEKAHPDVMNILLQVLDEGKINDSHGRTISFKNTIIIMTSNAGSDKKVGSLGFDKNENELTEEKALKALSEFLRPEFLSRVDEIVVFNNLKNKDLMDIGRMMLDEFVVHLKEKGISFEYEESSVSLLINKLKNNKHGARGIRTLVRKEVEDKLASMIIQAGSFDLGRVILRGIKNLSLNVVGTK
ncbi:MAG: ATP-dependent Clp protease ATP-binding subunit [Firmicutes bacterium]|nr:ATP-dependent Clp protease ATP-binding subunit [Bacillota bacterium]